MTTLTEKSIIKSRSGVYSDTSENRRKNRVGQKYGADGKSDDDSKDFKKESLTPEKELEAVNKVIQAIAAGKVNLPNAEVVKLYEKRRDLETKVKHATDENSKEKPESSKKAEPKKESEKKEKPKNEDKSEPQKERVSLSGWEANSFSDVKKYGEDGVVESMAVQAVPNLKEKKYEYSASVSASKVSFEATEAFHKEAENLKNKLFPSPNEAAKAADEFANKWNSKDSKSESKQGETEESYTRVKFEDVPNSGKVNLKKYLSEKMKKSADEAWGDISKIDTKGLQKMEKGLVEDFNRQFDDLPKSRRAEKLYAIIKVKGELAKRGNESQKTENKKSESKPDSSSKKIGKTNSGEVKEMVSWMKGKNGSNWTFEDRDKAVEFLEKVPSKFLSKERNLINRMNKTLQKLNEEIGETSSESENKGGGVGEIVVHDKFGEGKIISEDKDKKTVTIDFGGEVGEKTLLPAYAPIKYKDGSDFSSERKKNIESFDKKAKGGEERKQRKRTEENKSEPMSISGYQKILLAVNDKWNQNSSAKLAESILGKIPKDAPDNIKDIADLAIDVYVGTRNRKQRTLSEKQAYALAKYLNENNL